MGKGTRGEGEWGKGDGGRCESGERGRHVSLDLTSDCRLPHSEQECGSGGERRCSDMSRDTRLILHGYMNLAIS